MSTLLGTALPMLAIGGLYPSDAVVLAERAEVSLNGEAVVEEPWPAWADSWIRQGTSLLEGRTVNFWSSEIS